MPLSSERVYDVAIVGGGILGVSVARDCAMRRLSVILLEQDDFASGTTGSATGILSGEPHWLRFDPEVTRLACEEINVFQRIAPNLLTRVPILYPVLRTDPVGTFDDLVAMASVYDPFAASKAAHPHLKLFERDLRALDTGLGPQVSAAVCLDEWTTVPGRITVATARSAAAAGARLHRRVRVESVQAQGGKLVGVQVVDEPSGVRSLVRARTVVNAAGPGAPRLVPRRSVEFRYLQRSYLLFERQFSSLALALPAVRRIDPLYLFPRDGVMILGPFEKPLKEGEREAAFSEEELNGLLGTVKPYFPGVENHRVSDVRLGVHCRVTDIRHPEGQPQAVFDHTDDGVEGLFTLVGGGITRARLLAENVTDKICKKLRQPEQCRTHLEALPGCTSEWPWREQVRRSGRDPRLVLRLIRRYGHKAVAILDAAERDPQLGQTVCSCEGILASEVEYVVRKEWVESMSDLRRRTGLGEGTCRGCQCTRGAARFLGSLLGWNSDTVRAQSSSTSAHPLLLWGEQLKQDEYNQNMGVGCEAVREPTREQ